MRPVIPLDTCRCIRDTGESTAQCFNTVSSLLGNLLKISRIVTFLSRVSTLTCDIDIALLCVRQSVCQSVTFRN